MTLLCLSLLLTLMMRSILASRKALKATMNPPPPPCTKKVTKMPNPVPRTMLKSKQFQRSLKYCVPNANNLKMASIVKIAANPKLKLSKIKPIMIVCRCVVLLLFVYVGVSAVL